MSATRTTMKINSASRAVATKASGFKAIISRISTNRDGVYNYALGFTDGAPGRAWQPVRIYKTMKNAMRAAERSPHNYKGCAWLLEA